METRICNQWISRWLFVFILLLVLALIALLAIRYYATRPVLQTNLEVKIHEGTPASLTKSVLKLKISELSGSKIWVEEKSLLSPVSSSSIDSGTNHYYFETRLVDISTNGFGVLFLKRFNGIIESTNVLFAFGKKTETSILDWNVVGTN
jgi:hypothetical protein